MTVTTYAVDFDDQERYVRNRPRADLYLHGPGGPAGRTRARIVNALVDTGADYSQLPLQAAQYVGLDPVNQGRRVRIGTAGGKVLVYRLDADLVLLGRMVTVGVHFGPHAAPLIGRQTLLGAMRTAGFQEKRWLQEWYVPDETEDGDDDQSLAAEVAAVEASARKILEQPRRGIRRDGDWIFINGVRIYRPRLKIARGDPKPSTPIDKE